MEIVSFFIFFGLVWFISQYHWLRIATCGFLLAASGSVALIAPIILAYVSFSKNEPFIAITQLIFGGFMTCIWLIPAKAAFKWIKWHLEHKAFWLPWNED